MKSIFEHKTNRSSERLKFNIKSQKFKSVKFGKNSIRVLGPILWNSLSNELRSLNSLQLFKQKIRKWGRENCPQFKNFENCLTAIN